MLSLVGLLRLAGMVKDVSPDCTCPGMGGPSSETAHLDMGSNSFTGEDISNIFPSFGAPKDKLRRDTLDFRLGTSEFIGLTYSSMGGG